MANQTNNKQSHSAGIRVSTSSWWSLGEDFSSPSTSGNAFWSLAAKQNKITLPIKKIKENKPTNTQQSKRITQSDKKPKGGLKKLSSKFSNKFLKGAHSQSTDFWKQVIPNSSPCPLSPPSLPFSFGFPSCPLTFCPPSSFHLQSDSRISNMRGRQGARGRLDLSWRAGLVRGRSKSKG